VTPIPVGASIGLVSVNVAGYLSNGLNFTVLPTPTITSLSPNSGPIGTWITITGTNFGTTQGSSAVTFNGTDVTTITSWSATNITLAVPLGTTTGNTVVTVGGVPSAGVVFTEITAPSMPSVVQVRPVDGASNVNLNSRVVLRFSQPVQPVSLVNGVFTLSQGSSPVSGSVVQSNDDLSLSFIPSQNLTASTTYSIAAVDIAVGQTSPLFQSAFTTGSTTDGTAPQVVQLSPPSAAKGVPINAPLVAQFNKPMDPSTLTPQAFSVTDNGMSVPGMVQVDPTGLTASFVPSAFFSVGHNISSNLASTIRDASGNNLYTGSSFSFTTSFSADSQGPSLIGASPSNSASGIPLNSLIVLECSKPLNVISVSDGFEVLAGGQPVSGGIALSDSNKRITFTPSSSLTANTAYTVNTTSQITDVSGFPLTNPGISTFTTGSTTDTTTPSVVVVDPASAAVAVPTNPVVQVQFSKVVNPLTVTAATLQLTPQSSGNPVQGTITVSSNGQTARFVPNAPLVATTRYVVTATNGITDLEGHALSSFSSYFTTGLGPNTTPPTVLTISPQNGATEVPVNLRVDVVMSVPLSVESVGSDAVTISARGTPVSGAVTLSGDGTTLMFTPSGLLTASTSYTVTVSGIADQAGNVITQFTSTFTTSSSGAANTLQPSVVSVSPSTGASAVSVGTPIVLTFNEAIDGSTVNYSTVPISINAFSGVLAGSYSLDATGMVLTFTPASPLPGNTWIKVLVNSSPTVSDLSGNQGPFFFSSFTTAATPDATPPTIVMVTPSNGATNIGVNAQVVLTFSKSLNPMTITSNNFGLFANGSKIAAGVSNSADNRVVTIISSVLPPSSTVEVVATGGVQDLSGNALGNLTSQFTTADPFDTTYPSVVAQRPGNGAIGVPLNTNVVLYIDETMNASTVQGAVHVSQNGVLVSGTTQVTDNGQVVQFTPSAQWQSGAVIQVFLDSTAVDMDGVAAANYQSSFTTAANNSATAPALLSSNPPYGATGVPTNVVIDMAYNQPLDPATLSASSVACYQNNVWFQDSFSLLNGGTLLQVVPRFPLSANTVTNCILSASILGTNGIPIANGGNNGVYFTTGGSPDNVIPTIISVSPPNGSSSVGDNAIIRLVFSKPVDPLTINASTIQLSGGGTTVVPDSISFSNNNQSVLLVPHAPLPNSTQMTLVISGITDVARNAVAPQTTQFTTGNGPDLVKPFAVNTSPFNNATNVPVNAVVILQANEPVDPGTVNGTSLLVKDAVSGESVPGTYSVSSDGLTVTFLPATVLTASHLYSVSFTGQGIADLAGNLLTNSANASDFNFTTGTTTNTSAPEVSETGPANGATAVPTNAQVMIQFNEPVNAAKLAGVTLTAGSGAVNVSRVLSNGNQTLTLIPALLLSSSTTYTTTVSGVQDLSGNVLVTAVTISFTTAAGPNLAFPTVASISPATGAYGVATDSVISVQFASPINPVTVTNATFEVYPNTTTIPVAGSIAVTADGLTATFSPARPLDPSTTFVVQLTGGDLDLEGRGLTLSSYFTTATGSVALAPAIVSLSQSSAWVGTMVWLNGTYFGTSQGSSTVLFNGVTATPVIWSDTQVFVTVPSGATSGPVTITVNGVTSNEVTFNVWATPNITDVSPASGSAGNAITITGTNFGDSTDSVIASFSGINATATSWSPTSIVVPIPASAPGGYVNLTVSVNNRVSGGVGFTVVPTPNIVVISPSSGVAGTPVTITGTNFGATQGSSTISFNSVAAASITSWSNGSIVAVPASNVSTGPVTMSVNSVSSNFNNVFTVTVPAIGNLTPPAAAVGARVNVNGSGFYTVGQTTQVFFNGIPATIILYGGFPANKPQYGNNQLTVVVPPGATSGTVTVEVGGVTSNSSAFAVETAPTVTGILPAGGQIGSTVLISGSGFGATQSSSSVNFYPGIPAQIVSWSDTAIQAIVPGATSTGAFNVQVATLTGQGPSFQITNLTQLTDSLGNQSSYGTAITAGSWTLSSSSGPGCSTCSVRGNTVETVDANGNVLTHTDDLGHVTTYTYDSNNNVTSVSQQLDANTPVTTSYTYNSFGEVLTMTDPLGNVTTNAYDSKGNLTSVTSPQPNGSTPASVTHFVYDTKGELTQITDPLTHPTNITYTPAGLIATITDAQQHTTTYQYDTRGNRTAVIDPINGSSHPTTFTYDIMNRLTAITYPDNSSVGLGYDYLGRRTSATDQNQKATTYAYDDTDRLASVTDPANNVTQYAYDTEGNLTSITDANNHTTYFAYSARGWVTQTTFPSTLAESYAYDAVGNLQTKTDRKNQTIQYVYDALNQLSSKTYPDSTSANYAYDLVGRIKQVTDPTGAYGLAYDNMGRLIGTTTQYAFLTGTFSNGYGYDAASNRTSLTAPDGSINTYRYDTLNLLNGITNSWAGTFGFGYDALSRRTSLTRPNGVNTSYGYDSVSRLLSVLHQTGSTTLDGASYAYDAAGNRTSKTNHLNNVTEAYTYDSLYELTQVVQGATTTENYSYDLVGDRLSSLGVSLYNYNASNELSSNSNGSYTYDNNGNTLTDASGRSYTWDFENRLSQAVVPVTGTVTFKYDPLGRRIQKGSSLGTTNYLYDGLSAIEDMDISANVLARYAQGGGIDEPLSELRSGTISYYEQDGLGSVTALSNSAGALANTYTYNAFGNLSASTGAIVNPFRYTGREFDTETSLHYYRARNYDSSTGRFISEDPIGLSGGVNFYRYVQNQPVNNSDPLGLKCTTKIMLVTAYCDHAQPTKSGRWPGGGTVAVANTKPQPYPMGCSVSVSGALVDPLFDPRPIDPFNIPEYTGTVYDTGAGWNSTHHNVPPDAWVDIWISPCKQARTYGIRYRKVTICCKDCK
jgi:RHS repeat-associated protein